MPPFVATVDPSQIAKIKTDLRQQGFEFSIPPHAAFAAKKPGLSCTVYRTGKIVVQGKNMQEFLEFYLEPCVLKEFPHTHGPAFDPTPRIGSDEAGKGDFFGPLCVASVYAGPDQVKILVDMGCRDSKTLSDKVICKIAEEVRRHFSCELFCLMPAKYNELYDKFQNLNRLLAWMHSATIGKLADKTGCQKALVDQFAKGPLMGSMLARNHPNIALEERTHAESDPVVAAASILARSAFVQGIDTLGEKIGMPLPKGAGAPVLKAGKMLVTSQGTQILPTVSKVHFQTTQKLV